MAEKIVFGADIDNVTIKNVNGVLVAVGDSEAAKDEVETLSAYTFPVEDDEHYVETTSQWLRHKPTQAVWVAKKEELKPRTAPVNESISEAIELEPTSYITTDSNIRLEPKHRNYTSNVDGKSLSISEINSTGSFVDIPKSQYANAKAFNEANAGKTFTVTTKKRYAKSEGHPVVKPTEIQVAYPTLKYTEGTGKAELGHDAYYVNAELSSSRTTGTFPSEFYTSTELLDEFRRAVSELDASAITMHYELVTTEGQTFTGDAPIDQTSLTYYNVISVDRSTISDYTSHTFKSEKWTLAPITVESFNFKLVISFEPYVDGNA